MTAARGQTKQIDRNKVESIEWPVDEDGQPDGADLIHGE